jgi:LacI family transcriptional regulator
VSGAPRRTRIGDLARSLGLSVSTVSRALNGYPDVNPETRRRIERQAEEMGYRPSSISLKLRKGRSGTVGFILPPTQYEFADPVFLAVLAGADEVLREAGVQLLISTSGGSEDQLPALRKMIESDQVDSMILARIKPDDPRIDYLAARGIPMSLLGRSTRRPEIPSVEIDAGGGTAVTVAHVAGLGRRRIGHITVPLRYNYGLARHHAFAAACAVHGLDPALQRETEGDLSEHGGYRAARDLLAAGDPPDAILCGNDAMAIGALHAIVQAGLVPGADISLIGFDDIPVAALVNPPLTTMRVPFHELGMLVARHLLRALGGEGEGLAHLERATFVPRAT